MAKKTLTDKSSKLYPGSTVVEHSAHNPKIKGSNFDFNENKSTDHISYLPVYI
jgi:hypothetical protein